MSTPLARRIGVGAAAFLVASLIAYESTSIDQRPLTSYVDIAGIPTVCDGITGPDVISGKTYTHSECDALLAKQADRHVAGVLSCIHRPLDVYEIVAWSHFAFNVGVGAFCTSTAARRINAGERACDEIDRWTYVTIGGQKVDCRTAGRTCPGIPVRRDRERAICEMRIRIPSLFDGVRAGVASTARIVT